MKNTITLFLLISIASITTFAQISQDRMPFAQENYPKVDNWNIAVFPIDFADVPTVYRDSFPTKQEWSDILFQSDISTWFNTTSYGTTTITGEVYDYTTSSEVFFTGTGVIPFSQVLGSIDITASEFDMTNYDYVVFITCHDAAVQQSITSPKDFTINGTAYNENVVCVSYQNGIWWRDAAHYLQNDQLMDSTTYVIPTGSNNALEGTATYPMHKFESILLHELGHSMGLDNHANTSTNGNQPDYTTEIPNNENFMDQGYGNKFDLMGKREYGVTMNGGMRDFCGLLDTSNIYSKNWYGTTTITVSSLMSNTGKRYIEVLLPEEQDFFGYKHHGYGLEIRTATNYSSMLSMSELSGNLDGFFVYKIEGTKNHLLDMSPSNNLDYEGSLWADIRDVVLKTGMTYENDDVKFENVVDNGDGTWSIDITIKATKTLSPEPTFTLAERLGNGDIKIDWVNNCTDCEADQIYTVDYREVGTDMWSSSSDAVLTSGTYTTSDFSADSKLYEFRGVINSNSTHYSSLYSNTVSTVTTSVSEINNSSFELYPNPTSGNLQLVMNNEQLGNNILIIDITGKIVKTYSITNTVFTLNIADLHNGIYLLKIGNSIQKLIKK